MIHIQDLGYSLNGLNRTLSNKIQQWLALINALSAMLYSLIHTWSRHTTCCGRLARLGLSDEYVCSNEWTLRKWFNCCIIQNSVGITFSVIFGHSKKSAYNAPMVRIQCAKLSSLSFIRVKMSVNTFDAVITENVEYSLSWEPERKRERERDG